MDNQDNNLIKDTQEKIQQVANDFILNTFFNEEKQIKENDINELFNTQIKNILQIYQNSKLELYNQLLTKIQQLLSNNNEIKAHIQKQQNIFKLNASNDNGSFFKIIMQDKLNQFREELKNFSFSPKIELISVPYERGGKTPEKQIVQYLSWLNNVTESNQIFKYNKTDKPSYNSRQKQGEEGRKLDVLIKDPDSDLLTVFFSEEQEKKQTTNLL